MAVAIDTSAKAFTSSSSSTQTVTLTVAANSDRCLVLGISSAETDTVTSVAFTAGSGGTWTELVEQTGTFYGTALWYCVAPSTGSVTVEVTWSGATHDRFLCLWSLYGVDQTTPMNGGVSNTDTAGITVTSATNDMVFGVQNSGLNPIPWSSGTVSQNDVNDAYHSAGYIAGGASVSLTAASGVNGTWCAGNVKQVAAATGHPTMKRWAGVPGMSQTNSIGRGW